MLAWSRDDQPRHASSAQQQSQQHLPPLPSLQRYHITSEQDDRMVPPPPTRIAAMRQLLRSSGAGASEAFLPRWVDDQGGPSRHRQHQQVVWTNDSIADRDTVATIELKPLTTVFERDAADPSSTSLEVTVIAEDPHKSFPTACIVSVSTNQMLRSADDELAARDIVIKEWHLSPPALQRTSISMRTITNIASVLHEGGDAGDDGDGSSTRRIFLTLRFVGCCDMSNRHRIQQVHLTYVGSGTGAVGSAPPKHPSSNDGGGGRPTSAAQRQALTSVMENVVLSPVDASAKRRGGDHHHHQQHHAVSGLNDSVDLEIRMDASPPPPPPQGAPTKQPANANNARAAYAIGDVSTASSTDGTVDRRSISPREPSHFRCPAQTAGYGFEEDGDAAVASQRGPRNYTAGKDVGDLHHGSYGRQPEPSRDVPYVDVNARSNSNTTTSSIKDAATMGMRTPTQNQRQRTRVREVDAAQYDEPNVVEIFTSPCGGQTEREPPRGMRHTHNHVDPEVMVLAISPIVGGGGGKSASRLEERHAVMDSHANNIDSSNNVEKKAAAEYRMQRGDVGAQDAQRDDEPVEMSVHEVELPPHADFAEEHEDIVLYSLSPAPAAPSSAPLYAQHHRLDGGQRPAQEAAATFPQVAASGRGVQARSVVTVPSLDVSETEDMVVRRSISMSDEDLDDDRGAMMPPTRGPPPIPQAAHQPHDVAAPVVAPQPSWQRLMQETPVAEREGVPPRSSFTSVGVATRAEAGAAGPTDASSRSIDALAAAPSRVQPGSPPVVAAGLSTTTATDHGEPRRWLNTSGGGGASLYVPTAAAGPTMRATMMHLPSRASFVAVKGMRAAAEWRGDTSDDSVEGTASFNTAFPRRPAPVMTEESLQHARRSISSLEQVPEFTTSDDLFARIGDVLGIEPQSISRPSSRRNSRASSVDSRTSSVKPTVAPPLPAAAAATPPLSQVVMDDTTAPPTGRQHGTDGAAQQRFGVASWRSDAARNAEQRFEATVDAITTSSSTAPGAVVGRFSIYDEDLPLLSASVHGGGHQTKRGSDAAVEQQDGGSSNDDVAASSRWRTVDTTTSAAAMAAGHPVRRGGMLVAIPSQDAIPLQATVAMDKGPVATRNRMLEMRAVPSMSRAPHALPSSADDDALHRDDPSSAALSVQQIRWNAVGTGRSKQDPRMGAAEGATTSTAPITSGGRSDAMHDGTAAPPPLISDVVLWCNKHHTSRNGTGRRCVVLRPTIDGEGVSFTMKKPDGSSWKGPAVPITSPQPLLESEGLAGNNLYTNAGAGGIASSSKAALSNTIVLEKSGGIQLLVGAAACQSPSIHQNRVRCGAHCVVVLRKGRLVTSMELDSIQDVHRFVDALQPVL